MRWCFGDQLGPHFLDEPDQSVLLIESSNVFERRGIPLPGMRKLADLERIVAEHRRLGDGPPQPAVGDSKKTTT